MCDQECFGISFARADLFSERSLLCINKVLDGYSHCVAMDTKGVS